MSVNSNEKISGIQQGTNRIISDIEQLPKQPQNFSLPEKYAELHQILENLSSGDFVKNKELRELVEHANDIDAIVGAPEKYSTLKDNRINKLRLLIHKIKMRIFTSYAVKFNDITKRITEQINKIVEQPLKDFVQNTLVKQKDIAKSIKTQREEILGIIKGKREEIAAKKARMDTIWEELPVLSSQALKKRSTGNKIKNLIKPEEKSHKYNEYYQKKWEFENLQKEVITLNQEVALLNKEFKKVETAVDRFNSNLKRMQKITGLFLQGGESLDLVTLSSLKAEEPKPVTKKTTEFPAKGYPNAYLCGRLATRFLDKVNPEQHALLEKYKMPLLAYLGFLIVDKNEKIEKIEVKEDGPNIKIVIKLKDTVQKYIHQNATDKILGGKVYNFGDNAEREIVIKCKPNDVSEFEVEKGMDGYVRTNVPIQTDYKSSVHRIKFSYEDGIFRVNERTKDRSMTKFGVTVGLPDMFNSLVDETEATLTVKLNGNNHLFLNDESVRVHYGETPMQLHETLRDEFGELDQLNTLMDESLDLQNKIGEFDTPTQEVVDLQSKIDKEQNQKEKKKLGKELTKVKEKLEKEKKKLEETLKEKQNQTAKLREKIAARNKSVK